MVNLLVVLGVNLTFDSTVHLLVDLADNFTVAFNSQFNGWFNSNTQTDLIIQY